MPEPPVPGCPSGGPATVSLASGYNARYTWRMTKAIACEALARAHGLACVTFFGTFESVQRGVFNLAAFNHSRAGAMVDLLLYALDSAVNNP